MRVRVRVCTCVCAFSSSKVTCVILKCVAWCTRCVTFPWVSDDFREFSSIVLLSLVLVSLVVRMKVTSAFVFLFFFWSNNNSDSKCVTFPGVAVFDDAELKVFDSVAWEAFALRSGENGRCSLRRSGDSPVSENFALEIQWPTIERVEWAVLRRKVIGPTKKKSYCFSLEVDIGRFPLETETRGALCTPRGCLVRRRFRVVQGKSLISSGSPGRHVKACFPLFVRNA